MAHDCLVASVARAEHHCNVLCLAVELTVGRDLEEIVRKFYSARPHSGRAFHQVEKVGQLEQAYFDAKLAAYLERIRELEARLARKPIDSGSQYSVDPPPGSQVRSKGGEGGGMRRSARIAAPT